MIRTVAVIGLGAMGAPMAKRLHDAGFALTVCDPNPAAVAPLAALGASVAATSAECAAADLVIVIVATPAQVREVLLGGQGVIAGLAGDRSPLVAVMGTMAPETVRELDAGLRPAGARLIEAPVSGGAMGAEQGTLTIMTGGADEDVAAAGPVFAHLGTDRFHCGSLGSAQTVKILNNILGIVNSFVSAETFRLAREAGLDINQVARILETGTGRNWITANPGGPGAMYAAMLRAQSFDAGLAIIRKDLELATGLAARSEGRYPLIDGFAELARHLGDETLATWRRITDGGH